MDTVQRPIRVLVVDDLAIGREILFHILNRDPQFEVVGFARDGKEAVEMLARARPDVITMDIHMPRMNGFEATRKIMETHPTPIVLVTASTDPADVEVSFRAMQAGALAVVARPGRLNHPDFDRQARELLQTLKTMSEVRLVRRRPALSASADSGESRASRDVVFPEPSPRKIRIVAIGASTGGPGALHTLLSALPEDFPVPVVVVQHITRGFVEGLVHWLDQSSPLRVVLGAQGVSIQPGYCYIAPDGLHMKVDSGGVLRLSAEPPEHGLRPAVSVLFRSVAMAYGPHAVGVLLTGMGKDGAEELKLMRDKGAITIAQDEGSCVVFGMPREAIRLGGARYVLPLSSIAFKLSTLVNSDDRQRIRSDR
ncbi:MAG: chemotaxis-specific protein-glutamate methyltransferase CheB [Calditrichaeota bacterium]|nr:MAG: chemotaxis-specific protein-glutamate methyltransferase CheB [Calditrichota bacterium]